MLPENLSPELIKKYFLLVQIGLGAAFIGIWWLVRQGGASSAFKTREADRVTPQTKGTPRAKPDPLAQARFERKQTLSLPGIRIDGEPHEVLGVAPGASADEVQKAYRDLMKRYHPDKVGRPGTREWQDAQKIAEALNRAKEELLKRARTRSGK